MTIEWPEQLFDNWKLRLGEYDRKPPVEWPERMKDLTTRDKELFGYAQTRNSLFTLCDGARITYRGDSIVWQTNADASVPVVGDLDVSYRGRSPIFEVKAFLPAWKLKAMNGHLAQGLDWPQRQDYLNEQTRTGRPFYVFWVWPISDTKCDGRGQRVDLLDWPPHAESLNRLRNVKGAKMAYWGVDTLRTLPELVDDFQTWAGWHYQETLAGVAI